MTEEGRTIQRPAHALANNHDGEKGDISSGDPSDLTNNVSEKTGNPEVQEGLQIVSPNAETIPDRKQNEAAATDEPYSTFTESEKIFAILTISFAALISPLSASTYYPAINSMAKDYGVSISVMNLSITIYQIVQGIGPSFFGNFSDRRGRRPAYIIMFTVYFFANVGLALQDSYAALMVLRCVQSFGGAPSIVIGSAVVADLATRAERGRYMIYAVMGVTLGPAFGPVVGGLLDYYLGWRAVFWFLAILSGVLFGIVLIALPETCRNVVGNGDHPPPKWNRSLIEALGIRKRKYEGQNQHLNLHDGRHRSNPFASLLIVLEKETGILLLYSGLVYAGYFGVLSTLTSQLKEIYHYNSLVIGLCYLPMGLGSLFSRWTAAPLLDWNFRRHAARLGIKIVKNRQPPMDQLPIELIRLQIAIPLVFLSAACICTYGWVMEFRTSVAGPLVMLFFLGLVMAGATTSVNIMIIDFHQKTPATASAANNLVRCMFSAAATGVASPLIHRLGIGWTATIITFLLLLFSPCLLAVIKWGPAWRKQLDEKERKKRTKRTNAAAQATTKTRA